MESTSVALQKWASRLNEKTDERDNVSLICGLFLLGCMLCISLAMHNICKMMKHLKCSVCSTCETTMLSSIKIDLRVVHLIFCLLVFWVSEPWVTLMLVGSHTATKLVSVVVRAKKFKISLLVVLIFATACIA